MKVLVAEDDSISAALFQAVLSGEGYRVTLAGNGQEALDAVRRERFDCIVTDWLMPRMDGMEFIRAVREHQEDDLPIVVVSALASEEARSHAMATGADGFLPKPCTPAQLTSMLRVLFDPNQAHEAADEVPLTSATTTSINDLYVRESLYQEFQPLVRRLISQYGMDPELRQDLEGEIYVQFFRLLHSFDPNRGIPFRAYVVSNLSRMLYTYVRGQWRRARRETLLEPADESALQDEHNAIEELTLLLSEEGTRRRVREAMDHLPPRQRQVVQQRYYEGREFEDIAEELGVKPATVRSLLRHALNNIRRTLVPVERELLLH